MHFSQKTTLLALSIGSLLALQAEPGSAQDPAPVPAEEPAGAQDDPLPEGVEAPVARMIEAAGGMEAWEAAPGLRFQVLETMRTLQNRNRNDWVVYTRVPMLTRLDPLGNGFILSEYAHPEELRPEYRRDVYSEGVAWAEFAGSYNRLPDSMARAEGLVRREFLTAAMPFSLHALGAELRYVRTEQVRDRSLNLFNVTLPTPVRMHNVELIDEFLLYVDARSWRATQLKWIFTGDDRTSLRGDHTWCHIDFFGAAPVTPASEEVGSIKLPRRRHFWMENPTWVLVWDLALPSADALPAASMRRPWFSGQIWEMDERADHWDPPEAEGAPGDASDG